MLSLIHKEVSYKTYIKRNNFSKYDADSDKNMLHFIKSRLKNNKRENLY